MKAVYEATYAIEELGVERGDLVVVEPGHPESPLLIVKRFDRNRLPLILDHLHRLSPVSFDGGAPPPVPQQRRWLREHDQRRRHLRAMP